MTSRLLHILNAEGDGKEAIMINGVISQSHTARREALSEIVDYERAAADKPSIWSGRIDGCYYSSGFVIKDERTMPFSFCSPSMPKKAQGELTTDLMAAGYTLDKTTYNYLSRKKLFSKAAVGICLATIAITVIILLCKWKHFLN